MCPTSFNADLGHM